MSSNGRGPSPRGGMEAQAGIQIAECIRDEHPALTGRVCVALGGKELWVPTLQGLVVRTGDQVLLQRPCNWPEPLVVGVVDGLAWREPPSRKASNVVTLKDDEAVVIEDAAGRPLFELRGGEGGPTVACLTEDLKLAAAGKLVLEGRRVEVRAVGGEAHIEATDDVVVAGEHIHLN